MRAARVAAVHVAAARVTGIARGPVALLLLASLGGCIPLLPEVDEPCATWAEPGLYRVKVEAETKTRKPYVYVPASAGPRDLVVMLHGGAQSGKQAIDVSGFMALADREGFVAVFPNGLGWPLRTWNAGSCCGMADEGNRDIDDVAFLDQLVSELSPMVCGDEVVATGFSNGAMMAHRWACEGESVAALVPVAGALVSDPALCTGEPVPIRHYHGTADTTVPASGGQGEGLDETSFPSVEETMSTWRERNRCIDGEPRIETLPGDTTCQIWDCEAATELCLVDGWGHAWPGGRNSERTSVGVTGALWSWWEQISG